MQQQQAAQATQANAERNARLNYGTQNIKNIFEGTQTGATPLDLSAIGKTTCGPNPEIAYASNGATACGHRRAAPSKYTAGPSNVKPTGEIRAKTLKTPPPIRSPTRVTIPTPHRSLRRAPSPQATPASDGSSGSLANGYSWKTTGRRRFGNVLQYGLYDLTGRETSSTAARCRIFRLRRSTPAATPQQARRAASSPIASTTNTISRSSDYYLPQEGQQ